jgi:hypothetical protein
MTNSKLETLQAELEAEIKREQRREHLEAQIKAEERAADARVQTELEIKNDPQVKAWREGLVTDIRAWHSDLLKLELEALEAVEALEVRRMALYGQGMKVARYIRDFYETRSLSLEYHGEYSFALEALTAQNIAPEGIRVAPGARAELQYRHDKIREMINFRKP